MDSSVFMATTLGGRPSGARTPFDFEKAIKPGPKK
jgi:hypothetical protein